MYSKILHIIYGAIIFTGILIHVCNAQNISVSPNRTRIFIGEQIKIKLAVENAHAGIEWFQFADTFNHLEVVHRSKIDTAMSGSVTNYYQTISVTSFDSGKWQFPALAIAGINQITMPVTIDVVPADVSNLKDYNDIKDIEEVQVNTNPVYIAILITLCLFSLTMLYILLQKKKAIVQQTVRPKNNETPWQWAERELNKLVQPNASSPVEVKNYYATLNDISRNFFSMQLHTANGQLTTDEWMLQLNNLDIEHEIKNSFFQFLRLSDSVRFAKFLPPQVLNLSAIDTLKATMHKTSHIQTSQSNYNPQPL